MLADAFGDRSGGAKLSSIARKQPAALSHDLREQRLAILREQRLAILPAKRLEGFVQYRERIVAPALNRVDPGEARPGPRGAEPLCVPLVRLGCAEKQAGGLIGRALTNLDLGETRKSSARRRRGTGKRKLIRGARVGERRHCERTIPRLKRVRQRPVGIVALVPVVGKAAGVRRNRIRMSLLDSCGDGAMHLLSFDREQVFDERFSHEGMTEGEPPLAVLYDPCPPRFCEGTRNRPVVEIACDGKHPCIDRPRCHSGRRQHMTRDRAELLAPCQRRARDRLGHAHSRAGAPKLRHKLLNKERDPLASRRDPLRLACVLGSEHLGREADCVRGGERREIDVARQSFSRDDIEESGQAASHGEILRTVRRDKKSSVVGRRACQMHHDRVRCLVGGLEVFQDHHGPRAAVGQQTAKPGRDPARHHRVRAFWGLHQRGRERLGIGDRLRCSARGDVLDQIDDQRERTRSNDLFGSRPHDWPAAFARRRRRFAHQPALADPALSGDQNKAASGVLKRAQKRLHLSLASDDCRVATQIPHPASALESNVGHKNYKAVRPGGTPGEPQWSRSGAVADRHRRTDVFLTLGIMLIVAIAIGYLLGGRLERLADLRLRWLPVLFACLLLGLLPLLAGLSPVPSRAVVAVANIGVLAFLLRNTLDSSGAVRVGMALLLAGWLLNAVVIVANGGMPLSARAYALSGQHDAITQGKGGFFKIVLADDDTVLKPLGDVIPLSPIHQVLSIGDLVLVAGIGVVVAAAMRAPSTTVTGVSTSDQPDPAI